MLNLDTHVLIAAVAARLRADEARIMGNNRWAISGVVLWELGHLSRAGRIRLRLDDPDFRRTLGRIEVFPITVEIAEALRRLDFRSDPADELIAATSLVHDLPLLTRDARMLASKVVPLALK